RAMVGFNEHALKHLTDSEYAVAGATAGGLTRAVSQPLDVIKIRFQLQVEPIKQLPNAKYWSVSQAFRRIIQEEGFKALWKGHVPAQVLSIIYGVAQVEKSIQESAGIPQKSCGNQVSFCLFKATCFEVLTREIWMFIPELRGSQQRPLVHFVCGGAAGVFASVVSFPFDIVRTRLVAQGEPKVYFSMSHALREILKREGPRGLFQGLAPVLIQMAPHSGIQFASYTALRRLTSFSGSYCDAVHIMLLIGNQHPKFHDSLAMGAIAGAISKTAVYPLDLAKKRLQIAGFENGRKGFGQAFTTSGLIHCIQKIVKTEGYFALYKGLWPSTIKAGVVSALYFTFYESTCAFLLRYK
ncbi:Mitochondrial thiamine pyrophosphate carrier, partial [Frankliniella fusca]